MSQEAESHESHDGQGKSYEGNDGGWHYMRIRDAKCENPNRMAQGVTFGARAHPTNEWSTPQEEKRRKGNCKRGGFENGADGKGKERGKLINCLIQ